MGIQIRDLRQLVYFLGIEVDYSERGTFVCQRCILDLVNKTRMLSTKPMETPIKANHEFKDELGTLAFVIKAAGRGNAIFTTPDIAFAISMNS